MAYNGSEGDPITLQAGATMTARFRTNFPTQVKARFFGKDLLLDILNQTGCKGIRMYFAQDANNVMELVIVGADANQDDIIGIVGDNSAPCPTSCSKANALNC